MEDDLLAWPPDVFALTDLMLGRSEAYRFALSPPMGQGWPRPPSPAWPDEVVDAARRWMATVDDPTLTLPALVTTSWEVINNARGGRLRDLSEGLDWPVCEALLTLHAIADEACAGLGVALEAASGAGVQYRARARELLVRTGSLSRIAEGRVRVLPKLRSAVSGSSVRSLSRYACLVGPGVETKWRKVPVRGPSALPRERGFNQLLLPWPLRVRASDFRAVDASIHPQPDDPFGYFQFSPSERLDVDLVDRLLVAALDEVERVHAVILPESAVDEGEIEGLEALLEHHGVGVLVAGVRGAPDRPGGFPRNWVHFGISIGERWLQIRQNKHHRWSLDEPQIEQYHLGGALHPAIRWWEAIEVPRRSVQFVEVGERATVVTLVCEDLAQIDDVADVIRSVGPTVVITLLLDGPQLNTRWAARYASVLADDPGTAVLTLTSYGMVQRSRGRDHSPSNVVALWKDAGRGTREIPLEPGAQAVLLTANSKQLRRHSSDGRSPVENGSEVFNVSVQQVRAAPPRPTSTWSAHGHPNDPALDLDELAIATSWAEAAAEALALRPDRVPTLATDAGRAAPWRRALGLPDPSPALEEAIEHVFRAIRQVGTTAAARDGSVSRTARAMRADPAGESAVQRLARQLLRSTLEQRIGTETSSRTVGAGDAARGDVPESGSGPDPQRLPIRGNDQ